VSKRLGSPYRSGRSRDWIKSKNPAAPAVKCEAEEDWGRCRRARAEGALSKQVAGEEDC
jgi:ATP-dependent DNA ligase